MGNDPLDRMMRSLERSSRRGRKRFTLAPITLGLALLVGIALLTELLPRVWSTVLPGGLDQAAHFRGWPGLTLSVAVLLYRNRWVAIGVVAALVVAGMPVASRSGPARWAFRLMAFAAVLGDFGIVYVILSSALEATAGPGLRF